MSHLFSGANEGLQHSSKLRILQGYNRYDNDSSSTFNYFPIIWGCIVGFFVLMSIGGLILRIRAMRRRRLHRPAPQEMVMTPGAGFQVSVSPQNYPQSYPHSFYPNQEQQVGPGCPYPNVNYPGFQNGVDPNAYHYGLPQQQQPGYTGGPYYQQNPYSGYAQQY